MARVTLASRSRSSATVAVATYWMPCAMAIAGRFLPWPKTLPGSGPTAMVVAGRAAAAALRDHPDVAAALHPERRGDAGRDCRGVAEERMDPRNLPGGLGVGGREHLQAAGGVRRHQLVAGGVHR